ncbi:hypothetical protein N9H37_03310 [Congregibacter sp.]|nr:hypothetical protein [Congregibacter sp.]MDA8962362.1 hypothetical protein [Congregibacter sp.]
MEQTVSTSTINDTGGDAQLVKVSGRMGSLLDGALGDGLETSRPGTSSSRRAAPKTIRIVNFEGWGPDAWSDGEVLGWFTFELESPEPKELMLSGRARIFIDGELTDLSPDGECAQIRIWANDEMECLASGDTLTINTGHKGRIWVGISMPDGLPVSFVPEIVDR